MKFKRQTLLAKIEGVYATDPVPANADAMTAFNIQWAPTRMEFVPRDLQRPYLGAVEQLPAAQWKTVEFDTEVAGSGAAGTAPKWGVLARMCAMGVTLNAGVDAQYKFISAAEESGTLYGNIDGLLHKGVGMRGTWSLRMTARQRPTIHWSLTGLFAAITDAALPAADWTGWQKPLVVNNSNTSGFQLHGYAGRLSELTIDAGVQAAYRNLVGVEEVQVMDRAATGSILIEHPTIAQKNYFTNVAAGTLGNLALTHGTVAGNKFKIDAGTVQLGEPSNEDLGGQLGLRIPLTFVPTVAGNDELTLTAL